MIHGIFKENQRAKYSKIVLMQPYSNINIGRRAEDFKCYASPLTKSAKAFLWREDHVPQSHFRIAPPVGSHMPRSRQHQL